MTTCADIITRALRKTGDLDRNELAEGPQLDDGMISLQGMYFDWSLDGVLGSLEDVLVDEDSTAGEWQRITATEAVSITLPATIPLLYCGNPTDADTPARAPYEGAVVVICQGSPHRIWRYAAGTWVSLSDLVLTDEAPLSALSPDGLACCLAMVLASDSPRAVNPACIASAEAFKARIGRNSIRAKVDTPVRTDLWRMNRGPRWGVWC